jgi:uncharacterized protein YPO0396
MGFSGKKTAPHGSLLAKLDFMPGPYEGFLALELGRRLNLSCVDSMDGFRKSFAALTLEGQVKLDNERHEKDDRRPLSDPRVFRLGSDRARKLAAFAGDRNASLAELNALKAKISDNDAMERELENRADQCKAIGGLSWEEIDASSLIGEISDLDEKIEQAQNKTIKLAELKKAISVCQIEQQDLIKNSAFCEKQRDDTRNRSMELSTELNEIMFKEVSRALTDENRNKLFKLFIGFGPLTLKNVNEITLKVERQLENAKNEWLSRKASAEHKLLASFAEFLSNWGGDSLDLEPKLIYAPEFIKKLEELENDGLPRLQNEFIVHLHKQSQQNVSALSTWLDLNLQTILKRMNIVNESLSSLPFNHGSGKPTFLNLRVADRRLSEVAQFKQDLKSVTSDLYSTDPFLNEERFKILKRLVDDLTSQSRDKVAWKELVLDVRRHVEFSGREIDGEGNEIETFRGGAGKSGGQRQKLAATCLAAALRYQLGGKAYGFPRFGTVVFDEAFDKIDNELTVITLGIFKNLGFQMIMATPMKNVTASEPYVGGAVYVSIAGRKASSVTSVVYDRQRKKLMWPDNRPTEADGDGS